MQVTREEAIEFYKNARNELEDFGFRTSKDGAELYDISNSVVSVFNLDLDNKNIPNPFYNSSGSCTKDLLGVGVEIISPRTYTKSGTVTGDWVLDIWAEVDYISYHETVDLTTEHFDDLDDLKKYLLEGY